MYYHKPSKLKNLNGKIAKKKHNIKVLCSKINELRSKLIYELYYMEMDIPDFTNFTNFSKQSWGPLSEYNSIQEKVLEKAHKELEYIHNHFHNMSSTEIIKKLVECGLRE